MADNNDKKTKKQNEHEKTEDKEAKKDPSASSGQGEVVLLKEKLEELENQNKRLLADYRNLEKRVEGERRNLILQSNKQLLLNLLPVLDTLILAQKHGGDQGLDLSVKQFLDILKQEGAEKIEVLGKSFDPHLMEAIDTIDGEEGKVMEEVRTGYKLYEQVLRPAQVRVGKREASSS